MTNTTPESTPVAPQVKNDSAKILGIVSLITSLIGLAPVALVIGYMSLNRFKKQQDKSGKGFATAGTIIGWIGILLVAFVIALKVIVAPVVMDELTKKGDMISSQTNEYSSQVSSKADQYGKDAQSEFNAAINAGN
jgi:uncharacterized protein YqhQ